MENTKNFYRAGPILFCYDNSGSWNSINPILTDTLFMWNYAKVVVGFMNSSAINNNHICILVMGYTTPETSKGADMTFWGWMWMYMQGMEVIYSWKLFEFWKFLRLPQSSIFFFFFAARPQPLSLSLEKNPCLPNGRCLSIPFTINPYISRVACEIYINEGCPVIKTTVFSH